MQCFLGHQTLANADPPGRPSAGMLSDALRQRRDVFFGGDFSRACLRRFVCISRLAPCLNLCTCTQSSRLCYTPFHDSASVTLNSILFVIRNCPPECSSLASHVPSRVHQQKWICTKINCSPPEDVGADGAKGLSRRPSEWRRRLLWRRWRAEGRRLRAGRSWAVGSAISANLITHRSLKFRGRAAT